MDVITEIADKVKSLLDNDLSRDLQTDYGQLVDLVKNYRGKVSVEDVQDALSLVISRWDLPDYEDEVVVDISCRLSGFCSSHVEIKWY